MAEDIRNHSGEPEATAPVDPNAVPTADEGSSRRDVLHAGLGVVPLVMTLSAHHAGAGSHGPSGLSGPKKKVKKK
jgi:hypothetical protein